MDGRLLAIVSLTVTCVAWHYGAWSRLRNLKRKLTLTYNFIKHAEHETADEGVKLETHEHHIMLKFTYMGSRQTVILPYDGTQVVHMSNSVITAYFPGTEPQALQQYPGVPLQVSANDIGAEKIVVMNYDTEASKIYSGDEILGYMQM